MTKALLSVLAAAGMAAASQAAVVFDETWANGQNGWSWWGGGGYFYFDGTDNIASLGWWDTNALWKDSGVAIEPDTVYTLSVTCRTGDGQLEGVQLSLQDTTAGWSNIVPDVDFWFPAEDRGLSPGPWRLYTHSFSSADTPDAIGHSIGPGIRIRDTSDWGQYGWLHVKRVTISTNKGGTIFGSVALGDWTGAMVPVTVEVSDAGGNVLESTSVTPDASGAFSVPTALLGTYDVSVKASHWLRSKIAGVQITTSGTSVLSYSLVNGDIDGDNAVTVFDYNSLSDAFDTAEGDPGWNSEADLDGDLSVTVFDYNILSANFDLTGD